VAEDQLVAANSLIGLNQNLGRLVGAAAGGAVLAAGGLPVIVIADAATFLLSATLIRGVHLPRNAAPARGTPARRPGGRAFARRPVWVALVVTAILAVGQGLFTVLFVVFVARNLHGDAAENGLLRAVQAIGAIIGGLALARATRVRPGPLTGLACLVFAAGAAVTWNLPHLTTAEPVYVALFIGLGVPSVAMDSGLISSLQHATADGERGGVFAAFGAAFALGQAAGIVAAGILGDRLGAVPLLNAQALCYLVGGVAALAGLAGGGQEAPPGLVNGVESPPMRPAGPEGARERAELAVTARRCAAQRLGRDLAGSPEEVAGHLLAIQAQDPRGARLAIRARSAGLSAADVDAALTGRRSMIVTWLNRGTLYLVRSEDYWWLHPLTTPQLRTGNARRLAQEGAPLPGRARPGV
jgi:predicted MFS family arabinose efflux permease